MKWTITTPPACEPLKYAECKQQARIDSDHERSWIENVAMPNVRDTAESESSLSLITRTITVIAFNQHDFRYGLIWLPRGPVQSVTSVTDANGAIASTNWALLRAGIRDGVQIIISPVYPVTIIYTAGFGDSPSSLPPAIRAMMLAHFCFLYENRSADVDPAALDRVYRRYRTFAG